MVKVLKVSMQHDREIDEVIEFNKNNNYEFIIEHSDTNMLDVRCLQKLLRNGYNILGYYDNLTLVHKNYKK